MGVDGADGTDTIRVRYRRRGRETTAITGIEKRQRPRSWRPSDRNSVIVLRTLSLPRIRLYPNTSVDCNGTFTGRAHARARAAEGPARRAGAKPKDDERKARTRRLIQAGGLIEKAGLLELEQNALYGALLSLRDGAGDKDQVNKWAALGGRAFAREARLQDEGKEAIVLTFPAALPKDATAALRAAGFRFNKVLQHWEGARPPRRSAKARRGPRRIAAACRGPFPTLAGFARHRRAVLLLGAGDEFARSQGQGKVLACAVSPCSPPRCSYV